MSKKNIGATLALYPCPVIVAGAMVSGDVKWTKGKQINRANEAENRRGLDEVLSL